MTRAEFEGIVKLIQDCDNYLEGRKHSEWIGQIAADAANRAVELRKESLYERLQHAGLNISEEI